MKKPNANIEWYNDGFSIEEQKEIAKQLREEKYVAQFADVKYICTIPTDAKLKQADKYISKLKVRIAQEAEYIEELEEKNKELETSLEQAQKDQVSSEKKYEVIIEQYKKRLEEEKVKTKKVLDKYSSDVSAAVSLDDLYQKQLKTIKEKDQEIEDLKRLRDLYIREIVKLREQC